MKKLLGFIGLLIATGLIFACASGPKTGDQLDAAIRETSDYLNANLTAGGKIAFLNIQSDYPTLSEYIIDELIANTVNDRIFSVVDRQQLDAIRAEQNFQMSGEVDDNTAQEMGRLLGAQTIISGGVTKIGDMYRLRVRALNVQSAQIEGQFNRNIPSSPTVDALTQSGTRTATATSSNSRNTPATGASRVSGVYVGSATSFFTFNNDGTFTGYLNGEPTDGTYTISRNNLSIRTSRGAASTWTINSDASSLRDGGGSNWRKQAEAPPPPPLVARYRVGDTGPAGGIIFYDKGNNSGGWRYLEAAPVEAEFQAIWSVHGTQVSNNTDRTRSEIGFGKQNTQLILAKFRQTSGEWDTATQKTVDLVIGGFNDWFLPSQAELDQMYGNLKRRNLGDFKDDYYWSSTENSGNIWYPAFSQNFRNGEITSSNKSNNRYNIRPIRQVSGPAN